MKKVTISALCIVITLAFLPSVYSMEEENHDVELEIPQSNNINDVKNSIYRATLQHTRLLEELDKLQNMQATQVWNTERKIGLGKTIGWSLFTLALLGTEEYCLFFSSLSTEAKVATSCALISAALGTGYNFLNHAHKVINNTHITEKIKEQLKELDTIRVTKKKLSKDITQLTITNDFYASQEEGLPE